MAADMDIEMDLDVGLTEEDLAVQDIEIIPDVQHSVDNQDGNPILSLPNDNDPTAHELALNKIHLRGLDNLTTKDIKAWAGEHYNANSPEHVEWIDDTSANLVYEGADIALDALRAFVTAEVADVTQIPLMHTVPAKPLSTKPESNLEVRPAVVGDRKQAGARDRSRFYLFNPEYDPAERRKRGGGGGRKYRDRDDGGYRSQRYDNREHENRMREDAEAGFDASLYDDDEAALARRAAKRRPDSSSDSDSRGRRVRFRGASGKELFPERESGKGSGILRDRSASPMRGDDRDQYREEAREIARRKQVEAASANRLRAQVIKAHMNETVTTKELFPHKTGVNHRRSDAFDAADETADLFAHKMAVPFTDGGADDRSGRTLTQTLATSNRKLNNETGFSIRGAAKAQPAPSFSIKGAASGGQAKELFPAHFGENSGKELFSERLEGRGRRRQKAEDLFH
ncbi:Uncharacterized protein BP5553_00359 [Venustampulla echinocandica]|uniref:Uncharacterized protein n=1 Tax=Venustampulla echinocandica TaxID=2656787 RepID=A0A370TXY7_9HELO|nr:Uncharacterized protein BP5553_00359 [Venustampulla echinocandica]RDL40380.1 Uncharacterized protein BP5553_00359 [Venustampulla echinocandica]